jgi:Zn-dependent protease
MTAVDQPDGGSPPPPRAEPATSKRGLGGVLVAIGALLLKFAKFLLLPLKLLKFAKFGTTMLSMAVTIWIYATMFGLRFAIGMVVLIFIHEMGHAGAMKLVGLRAGAPVFIPFLGAAIAMKDQPRDVLTEAKIAIAGPLVGACAAAVCLIPWTLTGHPLWLVLANVGFFLNLFNLLPVSPLDGGRTVGAISRKLWYVGFALLAAGIFVLHNYFLLIVVLMALPQLRQNKARPPGYFEVPASARAFIAFLYFGLAVGLGIAMMLASERLALIRAALR